MPVDPLSLDLTPTQVRRALRWSGTNDSIARRVEFYLALQENPIYPLLLLDTSLVPLLLAYQQHQDDHIVLTELGGYLKDLALSQEQEREQDRRTLLPPGPFLARYVKTIACFAEQRGWTDELRSCYQAMVAAVRRLSPNTDWDAVVAHPVEDTLRSARMMIDPGTLVEE